MEVWYVRHYLIIYFFIKVFIVTSYSQELKRQTLQGQFSFNPTGKERGLCFSSVFIFLWHTLEPKRIVVFYVRVNTIVLYVRVTLKHEKKTKLKKIIKRN